MLDENESFELKIESRPFHLLLVQLIECFALRNCEIVLPVTHNALKLFLSAIAQI